VIKMQAAERPEIEAARKGGDPDRPIDGEDPGTRSLDVARRWWRVYGELEKLETELVDHLAERAAEMSDDARREAAETNLPVLLSQLHRFRERHTYWRQRAQEVETGTIA
jgi:hypothetical protein